MSKTMFFIRRVEFILDYVLDVCLVCFEVLQLTKEMVTMQEKKMTWREMAYNRKKLGSLNALRRKWKWQKNQKNYLHIIVNPLFIQENLSRLIVSFI